MQADVYQIVSLVGTLVSVCAAVGGGVWYLASKLSTLTVSVDHVKGNIGELKTDTSHMKDRICKIETALQIEERSSIAPNQPRQRRTSRR